MVHNLIFFTAAVDKGSSYITHNIVANTNTYHETHMNYCQSVDPIGRRKIMPANLFLKPTEQEKI